MIADHFVNHRQIKFQPKWHSLNLGQGLSTQYLQFIIFVDIAGLSRAGWSYLNVNIIISRNLLNK